MDHMVIDSTTAKCKAFEYHQEAIKHERTQCQLDKFTLQNRIVTNKHPIGREAQLELKIPIHAHSF